MKFKPWKYQRRMRRFLLDKPNALEFVDMGLGKTVVMLGVIDDLIAGMEIRSALVVAPIRVCETTWPDETALWDHTRHLRLNVVRGSPAQRLEKLKQPADIYLINYELLPWLAEVTRKIKALPFDMIVFDESSKMKSHASKRFKKVKPMLPKFRRRVCMTGTPAPRSYLDLFSQTFCADGGERLGLFFTHFRDRYFDFNQYTYECTIKEGAARAIRDKIRDITLSMRSQDYLDLPKIVYNNIKVPLPPTLRKQYEKLQKEMFLALDNADIEAFNAAALSNKCRQFTSGVLYDEERNEHVVHDAKIDALADIIEDAGGQSLLVVYEFKSEMRRLLKRWPKASWIGGGSKGADAIIKRWNTGDVPILFAHGQSIGHGLNLQHGGHMIVWTSCTWDLDLYLQMNKRLHRPGQKKPVIVNHLVMPDTVDMAVMARLANKDTSQAALVKALRSLRGSK